MSKQHAKAKRLQKKYVETYTRQPLDVRDYVAVGLQTNPLQAMFIRLLIVLASRNFLHAAELKYIVEGFFVPETQYADWSPEKEISTGLDIPIIKER